MPDETLNISVPQSLIVRPPHLGTYDPTYDLGTEYTAEFFAYQFPEIGPLAAGAAIQANVQIQANVAFEMREIVYFWNLANAAFTESTRPIPNATIQLQDSGSGKNLFSAPVPLDSIAVNGFSRRRALIWPRIFAPNSTINATIQNFDAAVATGRLRLTLIGRHLYRLAQR